MARAMKATRVAPRRATPARAAPARGRIAGVDVLRGIALCMMFGYHFAFDLRYFEVVDLDFENGIGWLTWRAVIVATFLTLVGVSIVLADRAGRTWRDFLRHLSYVAAGALAATAASWLLFPARFIYFGVLHCIVVTSLLAWPLRRAPRVALGLAAAILVAGLAVRTPMFDAPWLSWLGFMTHKPATEDYVPLAPWAAAVFAGIAAGHVLARTGFRSLAPLARLPGWLGWLGRHSLIVYLAHQPILMAVLWLLVRP